MKQAERRASLALTGPQNPASNRLYGLKRSRNTRKTAEGSWYPISRAHDINSEPIPSARDSWARDLQTKPARPGNHRRTCSFTWKPATHTVKINRHTTLPRKTSSSLLHSAGADQRF